MRPWCCAGAIDKVGTDRGSPSRSACDTEGTMTCTTHRSAHCFRSADFPVCRIAGFLTCERSKYSSGVKAHTPCRPESRRYGRLENLRYVLNSVPLLVEQNPAR